MSRIFIKIRPQSSSSEIGLLKPEELHISYHTKHTEWCHQWCCDSSLKLLPSVHSEQSEHQWWTCISWSIKYFWRCFKKSERSPGINKQPNNQGTYNFNINFPLVENYVRRQMSSSCVDCRLQTLLLLLFLLLLQGLSDVICSGLYHEVYPNISFWLGNN
jgi:hypothetical protein